MFGFASGGVYAKSGRRSASRFFWSRPVVIEFDAGHARLRIGRAPGGSERSRRRSSRCRNATGGLARRTCRTRWSSSSVTRPAHVARDALRRRRGRVVFAVWRRRSHDIVAPPRARALAAHPHRRSRAAHAVAARRSADARRSASSGTTRARGCTTRATARCGARGGPTSGTRCSSRRSSRRSNTARFEAFGVGTWQARLVPVARASPPSLLLMLGLSALAGPRVALIGGALLATNYVFVMWNRAALMESTMTALIVAAGRRTRWPERRPAWGVVAGVGGGPGVVHEGGGGVLRGGDRARRARLDRRAAGRARGPARGACGRG